MEGSCHHLGLVAQGPLQKGRHAVARCQQYWELVCVPCCDVGVRMAVGEYAVGLVRVLCCQPPARATFIFMMSWLVFEQTNCSQPAICWLWLHGQG